MRFLNVQQRMLCPLVILSALAAWGPAQAQQPAGGGSSGQNLITDGASFEAGLDGCALGLVAGRLNRECALVALEIDPTTAADGQCSLKFVRPPECRLRYGLFYRPVTLRPGRAYTFSAWMKASRDGAGGGLSLFAAGGERGRPGMRPQTQMFQLTTRWARYELHIPSLPPSAPVEGDAAKNVYWVVLHPDDAGATVWIDAVQLEEGASATPFAAAKPLELGLSSNRPGNQFWAGETIVPQVRLYAPGAKSPITVKYRAVDIVGDEAAAGSKELRAPPDGHLTAELAGFSLARRGWATIEAAATCDGREEKEYLNVAVLEKIQPPLPDQPCQFGFDYNAVTSPDDFGPGGKWNVANIALDLDRVFRLAPQAGARWQRAADIVRWDDRPQLCVETAPGRFTFHDDGVKAIRGYGLEAMATLGNANARQEFCPAWARSAKATRRAPIPTDEAWRRYVRAMVQHYKGEIKHWEIINEPNTAFWPQDYVPLLVAACEEVKRADPDAKVVGICATADQEGDPYGYVRAVAEAGALKNLDIVSGHTFCKPRPWMSRGEMPTWDYLTAMQSLLKKHAPTRELPLWNTEGVKYPCWSGRPDAVHTTAEFAFRFKGHNMCASQRLAAAYVVRDCAIEFCGGARVLFLWQFRNELVDTHLPVAEALGTVDFFAPDGTPQAKFVALNALADKLRGARPVEHFGLSPQVRCAVFDGPAGAFALVWRENEDENDLRSYTLSVRGAVEVQDLFGRPLKPERAGEAFQVKVSEIPVYLVGEKTTAGSLAAAAKEAAKQVDFKYDKPLKNTLLRGRRG